MRGPELFPGLPERPCSRSDPPPHTVPSNSATRHHGSGPFRRQGPGPVGVLLSHDLFGTRKPRSAQAPPRFLRYGPESSKPGVSAQEAALTGKIIDRFVPVWPRTLTPAPGTRPATRTNRRWCFFRVRRCRTRRRFPIAHPLAGSSASPRPRANGGPLPSVRSRNLPKQSAPPPLTAEPRRVQPERFRPSPCACIVPPRRAQVSAMLAAPHYPAPPRPWPKRHPPVALDTGHERPNRARGARGVASIKVTALSPRAQPVLGNVSASRR